ncbi:zinc transporter 3-like isoform X2 [Bidens hawaiensis]|uniref:zinc transporter 3-like isoform X2 n=1 Tax=Bidens hawaiensis TaxID=980011 RepID=UPI00404A42FA
MELQKLVCATFLLSTLVITNVVADCTCEPQQIPGDKNKALHYKLIAIASILTAGVIGVSLPFAGKIIPALHPDKDGFFVVKTFAAGVILATGFIHILPQAFKRLTSPCLEGYGWWDFPLTGLVAMVATIATLLFETSSAAYQDRAAVTKVVGDGEDQEMEVGIMHGHVHGSMMLETDDAEVRRYRIVSQAKIKSVTTMVMGACFALMTPSGIVVGILVSNTYDENSSKALIVEGVLDAAAAGILIYMALVDLLSPDFKNPRMQNNKILLLASNVSLFLGAGLMSLLAIWA